MVDRYILRSMNEEDIKHYNEWSNDYEVVQYTYPVIKTFTIDDTKEFFKNIRDAENGITYIIEDSVIGLPIGITSLINIDRVNKNAEFIIDIGNKNYWGKGIGRLIVSKMISIAFYEKNLHRLSLRVFSFNNRAINLYKSLGFTEEGRTREAIRRYETWHDIVHMGLLRKEHTTINE